MLGLRLGRFTSGTADTKERPVETIRVTTWGVRFEVDMTTWREDALKGAAIGALVFLGAALLLGMAYGFR